MSDKDLIDLLGVEEEDDPNDVDDSNDDASELKKLIEDLKKENQGLLKAKQEEKRKRQENQTRLETIESKINTIIDSKKKTNVDEVTNAIKGIPVEFTPDGEAFIPQDKLNEWSKPYQQKINELQQLLQTTRNDTIASQEAEKTITRILGEDERYPAVYNDYQKARDWINKQVIDYMKENNLKGAMSGTQALDIVFSDDDLEKQFQEKFPSMDLESVIVAEDSTRLFKKMLKTHVEPSNKTPLENNDDKNRFGKVLNKPSNLGHNRNAKTDLSIMDKLETLSQDDIMNLSDKQIADLEKALREEELRG